MMVVAIDKTILIVEDSDDDFLATTRAFRKANLNNPVQRCSTGDQALDYLYRRGSYADAAAAPRPCIILLDLNLPGTDGREILRIIKSDHRLHRIPIIVLTTSNAEQDVTQCYDAGANSYVQKQVDMEGFVRTIALLKAYWLEVSSTACVLPV